MKFSIKDLVTFTEEIFNGKLHVLCRVWACFRIFHELLAIFRVLPNILSVSQKAPSYMDDLVLNKHQVFLLQFILWWWKVIANNDNNKKRRAKSVISLDFLVINFREKWFVYIWNHFHCMKTVRIRSLFGGCIFPYSEFVQSKYGII